MRINYRPAMTCLLTARRIFREEPFVLVDVGALGGIPKHYEAFGDDMRVIAFEPNEDAITRLVGAVLLEQNDEWAVQRSRYITLESIAPVSDDPIIGLPAVAA